MQSGETKLQRERYPRARPLWQLVFGPCLPECVNSIGRVLSQYSAGLLRQRKPSTHSTKENNYTTIWRNQKIFKTHNKDYKLTQSMEQKTVRGATASTYRCDSTTEKHVFIQSMFNKIFQKKNKQNKTTPK